MEGFRSISDLVPATPPLPPPPFRPLTMQDSGHNSPSSSSYSLSLLVITAIIAFVIIVTASIHLLLRFLSRTFSSSSPQLIRRRSSSSFSSSSPHDQDQKVLVDSLPLFSLAHSLAALPKSSPDCAVCLSAFRPHDELRLLPACRHAFHAPCIDTWLRSSPSCPLCRSTITLPPPPALPLATAEELRGSEMSFRIEIGNVSRRGMLPPEEGPTAGTPPHARSYSLGTSFEYVVEEEVLARLPRMPEKEEKEEAEIAVPLPPGVEVAEAAGEQGRGWLKEYVDRLASSSFNSLRFSGRWRRLFDGGDGGGGGGGESLEFQLEEGGLSTFYRWLTGV